MLKYPLLILVYLAMTTSAAHASAPPTTEPTPSANGKYCLRVEAVTGSKVQTVQCMTREQWVAQGVDLDEEWAEEGVVLQA